MAQARWLNAEEQHTWRAFLAMMSTLREQMDRQLQDEAGIPHAYYEILVHLSEAPERMLRMSQLADRVQSSRSRLSHAVARLEQKGWVRRVACPSDKRGLHAVLTEEGFAALAAAAPGHVTTVRQTLFDPLTDEQVAQLRAISEAVLRAAPAEAEAAGDPAA